MSTPASHYDVLGVAPDADADEVRRAYLDLARRHHPDRVGGDAERMRAVNQAWATLGDPTGRLRYDEARSQPRSGAPNPRRSPVPDPAYPFEESDELDDTDRWADLSDDFEYGHRGLITVGLPGWLAIIPVGLFVVSVVILFLGVLFGSGPILALALMTFTISALLFLSAPFIALLLSRGAGRRGGHDVGEG